MPTYLTNITVETSAPITCDPLKDLVPSDAVIVSRQPSVKQAVRHTHVVKISYSENPHKPAATLDASQLLEIVLRAVSAEVAKVTERDLAVELVRSEMT